MSTRPLVHLNLAIAGDGRIADDDGRPVSISCVHDWRRVHELRERYTAVAVGAHTWRLDRPRLNVRREHLGRAPRRQPARVVFAGSQACDIRPDGRPTVVIGRDPGGRDFGRDFRHDLGGTVAIESPDRDLAAPLRLLRERCDIASLLVEGGLTLWNSFLSQGQADIVTIYVRTAESGTAEGIARAVVAGLPASLRHEPLGDGMLLSHRRGSA